MGDTRPPAPTAEQKAREGLRRRDNYRLQDLATLARLLEAVEDYHGYDPRWKAQGLPEPITLPDPRMFRSPASWLDDLLGFVDDHNFLLTELTDKLRAAGVRG